MHLRLSALCHRGPAAVPPDRQCRADRTHGLVIVWILLVIAAGLSLASIHQEVTGNLPTTTSASANAAVIPLAYFQAKSSVAHRRSDGRAKPICADPCLGAPPGVCRGMGRFSRVASLAAIVCAALISIAIALTLSRGAAVGFALVVAVMFVMRYVRYRYLARYRFSVVALLIAVPQYGQRSAPLETASGVSAGEGADGSIRSRLTEMVAGQVSFSLTTRSLVWARISFRQYYQDYAEQFGLRVKEEQREAHDLLRWHRIRLRITGLDYVLRCDRGHAAPARETPDCTHQHQTSTRPSGSWIHAVDRRLSHHRHLPAPGDGALSLAT